MYLKVLETTQTFLRCPATVGFEEPFIELLTNHFNKCACRCETVDGGLWVYPHDFDKYNYVFTSHIDRHGFIGGKDLTIYYADFVIRKRNGLPINFQSTTYEKIIDRFVGEDVYFYKPDFKQSIFQSRIKDAKAFFTDKSIEFYLEDTIPEAYDGYPVGLKNSFKILGQNLQGQLDNVVSAAVLHTIVAEQKKGPAIFFSKQEEVGNSFRYIINAMRADWVKDKSIICLDTTPIDSYKKEYLDHVFLRNRDKFSFFSQSINNSITKYLQEKNIPYTFKDKLIEENSKNQPRYGITELGRVLSESTDLAGISIQIPSINYHTNMETVSRIGLENYIKMINFFYL